MARRFSMVCWANVMACDSASFFEIIVVASTINLLTAREAMAKIVMATNTSSRLNPATAFCILHLQHLPGGPDFHLFRPPIPRVAQRKAFDLWTSVVRLH